MKTVLKNADKGTGGALPDIVPAKCSAIHEEYAGAMHERARVLLDEAARAAGVERVEYLTRAVLACALSVADIVAGRTGDEKRMQTALRAWEQYVEEVSKQRLPPADRLARCMALLDGCVRTTLESGCVPCPVLLDRMVRYAARIAFSCDGDLAVDMRAQLRLANAHVPAAHCAGERKDGPVRVAMAVCATNSVEALFAIGDSVLATHPELAGAVWTRALSVAELELRLAAKSLGPRLPVLRVSARNSFFTRLVSCHGRCVPATQFDAPVCSGSRGLVEQRVLTMLCTSVALYADSRGDAPLCVANVDRAIACGLLPAFAAVRSLHRDLSLEPAYRMALALVTALTLPPPVGKCRVKLQDGADITYQVWKRTTIAVLIRVAAEVNAQLNLPLPRTALLPKGAEWPGAVKARSSAVDASGWCLDRHGWLAPGSRLPPPPLSWVKAAAAKPGHCSAAMWEYLHDAVFARFCVRMRDRIRGGSACIQARK